MRLCFGKILARMVTFSHVLEAALAAMVFLQDKGKEKKKARNFSNPVASSRMGSNNDLPWWQALFGRKEEEKPSNAFERATKAIPQEIRNAPIGWAIAAAAIGIPASFALFRFIRGTRYPTAAHIPPHAFAKQQKIKGKVVSVGDSDNFRVYHTPGIGWGWLRSVPTTKKGKEDTSFWRTTATC